MTLRVRIRTHLTFRVNLGDRILGLIRSGRFWWCRELGLKDRGCRGGTLLDSGIIKGSAIGNWIYSRDWTLLYGKHLSGSYIAANWNWCWECGNRHWSLRCVRSNDHLTWTRHWNWQGSHANSVITLQSTWVAFHRIWTHWCTKHQPNQTNSLLLILNWI